MKLNDILESEPLSKALQRTYILAQERKATELATWLQLELGGYYATNNAWSTSTRVPNYRTVTGVHFNAYGQRLQLPPDMLFVNTLYLREPVEVLESLKNTRQTVVVQDPDAIEWIAEHLKVQLATFHFDTVEVVNILSRIRSELISRAQVLADAGPEDAKAKSMNEEEVIMLSPNFYGVGINFRALWRRVTSGRGSR